MTCHNPAMVSHNKQTRIQGLRYRLKLLTLAEVVSLSLNSSFSLRSAFHKVINPSFLLLVAHVLTNSDYWCRDCLLLTTRLIYYYYIDFFYYLDHLFDAAGVLFCYFKCHLRSFQWSQRRSKSQKAAGGEAKKKKKHCEKKRGRVMLVNSQDSAGLLTK